MFRFIIQYKRWIMSILILMITACSKSPLPERILWYEQPAKFFEEALPLGVYLHGLAADMIVERIGPAPVLAVDVIKEIPTLLGRMEED